MPKPRMPHLWAIPLRRDWWQYEKQGDTARVVFIVEEQRPSVVVCVVALRTSWPYTLATARAIVAANNKAVRAEMKVVHDSKKT